MEKRLDSAALNFWELSGAVRPYGSPAPCQPPRLQPPPMSSNGASSAFGWNQQSSSGYQYQQAGSGYDDSVSLAEGSPTFYGGQSVDEHAGDQGIGPLASSAEGTDQFAGLDMINAEIAPQTKASPTPTTGPPTLTEDEARHQLFQLSEAQCCWGSNPARYMQFRAIQQITAVQYVLRTHLETRSTRWAAEPYHGHLIDSPLNGPAPLPWQVAVPGPKPFENVAYDTEVPHTASVRVCYHCLGSLFITCRRCKSQSRDLCLSCIGSGQTNFGDKVCSNCSGQGKVNCSGCTGHGRVSCPTCLTAGRLKYYVRLTTKYETHTKELIIERTRLPNELIRDVSGTIVFEDTQPMLQPIRGFAEPEVNIKSAQFILEHRELASTGRILTQSHVIRRVPVFQCDAVYKERPFQFFVYGDDRAIYCDCYPHTCCFGCEIL